MGILESRRLTLCACLGAVAISPLALSQTTYNWRGIDGDWSDPASWNPTGVPGRTSYASIGGTQSTLIEFWEVSELLGLQMTNPNAEMYIYGGSMNRSALLNSVETWNIHGRMTVAFGAEFLFNPTSVRGVDVLFRGPSSRLTLEPESTVTFGISTYLQLEGALELQSLDDGSGSRLNASVLLSSSDIRVNGPSFVNASQAIFARRFTGNGSVNTYTIPIDCLGVPWTTIAPDELPSATGQFRLGISGPCRADFECDLRAGGASDRLTFVTNQSQVQLRVLPQLQGVNPTLGMTWHIIDIANATANSRNITIAQNMSLPNPRWGIRPRFNATTIDAVVACNADYNIDGIADFFDYLDFVADFAAARSGSDFNADFVVDFFDYLDFVAAFADGC